MENKKIWTEDNEQLLLDLSCPNTKLMKHATQLIWRYCYILCTSTTVPSFYNDTPHNTKHAAQQNVGG